MKLMHDICGIPEDEILKALYKIERENVSENRVLELHSHARFQQA